MRRTTAFRMAMSGLIATVLLGRAALCADKAPNDRILPKQTYAFLTVPNVTDLKSRFDKSSTGQLLKEPKLADFVADVKKKLTQLAEQFQQTVGLKIDDVLAVPEGEFSLAVLQPEKSKLAVALILDFGKSGSTVNALLEKATSALEKQGFKKTTKDIDGSQVTVYEKKKTDDKKSDDKKESAEAPGEFGSQLAFVIKEETLIAASSVPAMKVILSRWDGKQADSLAEVSGYKAISESGKRDSGAPSLIWYVSPVTLVQSFFATQTVDPTIGMALGVATTLGIDNLNAIGGTLHMGTTDFEAESRTLIHLERPASGLLNVFQFPPVSQSPPKWVAEDATSYISFHWDIAKAYTTVETIVDQFTQPGFTAQKLDDFANQENGPKVHLKKDILDNLDGMFQVVSDLPDTSKPESSRLLVAIGVKDTKKMKDVLAKVAKIPGFPGATRDFKGETVYEMEGNPIFGDASRKMGAAVANNSLMVSNDVARIEQAIIGDKDRKPLADSERYRKLASHFPAQTSAIWYQKQDTQMEAYYGMLKSGKFAEKLVGTPFAQILGGIDFKKLPDFEVIRKYLPPTGSYAIPNGNGALIVSFTLKNTER